MKNIIKKIYKVDKALAYKTAKALNCKIVKGKVKIYTKDHATMTPIS